MAASNMIQGAVNGKALAQSTASRPGARMDKVLHSPALQEHFNSALKDKAPAFMASILDLYSSDNYLQQCDPSKVALECLKAATLNLPINKQLGFAWIVPYKGVPQFQMGYKGYIQLAQRTGAYRYINADVVYEGELKAADKLTGNVDLSGTRTSDKVVGYFAYIETLNGFSKTLYMSYDDVVSWKKRYSKSANSNSSAWATNFDEMAIKTCVRRLISKWGVMSVEMAKVFDAEDNADLADNQIMAGMNLANMQEADAAIIPNEAVAYVDPDTGELTADTDYALEEADYAE